MKKITFTLLALVGFAFSANAQIHHPEYWLEMKWFVNGNPSPNKTIAFGYDALASDSLGQTNKNPPDSTWLDDIIPGGEQQSPGPSFGDYVAFTGYTIDRAYMGAGSYVDIRHKPQTPSFSLTYEISVVKGDGTNSFTFLWDKSKIPAIIKHIIIEPATIGPGPARRKTDMKEVSQFDLPNVDSISKYAKMLLTIYYNQELSVVQENETADNVSVDVFPNPMNTRSAVTISTHKGTVLGMQVYDVLGRKVIDRLLSGAAGSTLYELNRSELPSAGMYYIRALTVSNGKVTTVTKAFQVY